MQKGHLLEFNCIACNELLSFSVFHLTESNSAIDCKNCKKMYAFTDETLKRQLKKFTALCIQLIDSEEILGNAAVGVDVNGAQVKIPYKLLLTRLNSSLNLKIGDHPISITFRIEPLKDMLSLHCKESS